MGQGRARLAVSLLVVVMGVAACSSNGAPVHPTAAAARQLRRAARRTLAAKSYKLRMGEVDVKHPHMVTAKYQAPDRLETGAGEVQMVVVGATSYIRGPGHSNTFSRNVIPANLPSATRKRNYAVSILSSALGPAQQIGAHVSRSGDSYVATTSKVDDFGPNRYTYEVSNGRVTDVRLEGRLRGKRFTGEYHYFDFGVRNVIRPPPADRVHDNGPSVSCGQGSVPSTTPPPTVQVCG
jgi:hypothetical protein